MKRLLAAFLLVPVLAFAAPVSPESAAELVRGYAAYTGGGLLDGVVAAPRGEPRAVTAEVEGDEVVLAWAFDMEPQGWVLVAGDDRMAPVVGFSAEGELGDALWNEIAPPYHFVRGSLEGMYRAVAGIPAPPAAAGAEDEDPEVAAANAAAVEALAADALARWAKYRAAAAPAGAELPTAPPRSVADLRVDKLLGDIQWSQSGSGENFYTPHHYVCGCVQTALGQIMYFHKWPKTGIGRITRNVSVSGEGSQSRTTQGGDGNGGPYKWDVMTPGYTPTNSNPQQAMARGALLSDLGILNRASYASDGTGAWQRPEVITGDLKYANAIDWAINLSQITNVFCCNFDAGYPVDAASSEHQVVFDGYGFEDGDLYYHVNLGWGGSSDGWYLFSDWAGYYLRDGVYNIFPDKKGEIVSGRIRAADGTPLSGATVTVKKADGTTLGTATSNAKGIWAYAGVPSGSALVVSAAFSGKVFEPVEVQMGTSTSTSPRECGNRWGVDLVGYNASKGTVRGVVRNDDGRPVSGLRFVSGDGAYSATSNAEGVFTFGVPAGWSGTVKPASGQGALTAIPAVRVVPALAAGGFAACDFTVSSRIYVRASATGANDGTSWENARTSLAAALAAAPSGAEIWVAEGVYKPTAGNDRKARFAIPGNTKVYGGFAGVETKRSERDWIANPTVLSGEIGNASSRTDNSPMIVCGASGAVLDGFVVSGAYCSSGDSNNSSGFGLSESVTFGVVAAAGSGEAPEDFSFLVEHCVIEDNDYYIPLVKGWVRVRNCIVRNNRTPDSYTDLASGGFFEFCTVVGNGKGRFSSTSKFVNVPWTYAYNCYFSNPAFNCPYATYGYSTSGYLRYNVHADTVTTSSANATNNMSVIQVSESLSTDARTWGRPPAASRAVDTAYTSGLGQYWAARAGATDFAGTPRPLGTAPDRGAWEITEHEPARAYATLDVASVGDTSATLAWAYEAKPPAASSSSLYVNIVVSTDPTFYYSASNVLNSGLGYKTPGASGTLPATGLKPGVDYYARLSLSGVSWFTPVVHFRAGSGSGPSLGGLAVSDVTETGAAVAAELRSLGVGSTFAELTLEISRTSDFSDVLATFEATATEPGTTAFAVTGLEDGRTYFARLRAVGSNHFESTSAPVDFTTVYVPNQPPKIGEVAVSDVTSSGAMVSVQLLRLGNGNKSATGKVEVSASPSFSPIAASAAAQTWTGAGTKTFALSGLQPGVVYYVRVTATGAGNSLSSTDTTQTFETFDPQRPTGSVAAGETTLYAIPVSWTLSGLGSGNSSAALSLEYGTTDAYGRSVSIGTRSAASSGTATISGLDPETEYWIRLRAVGSPTGKTGVSEPVRVSTQPVGKPTATAQLGIPAQTSVPVTWGLTALGEGAKNATVYVDYGTTVDFECDPVAAATARTTTGSGTATLSGLQPGTKYYVRVRAVNDAGKVGVSATRTVTTVQPDEPTFEVSATPHYTGAAIFADVALLGHQASSAGGTVVVSTSASLSPAVATATLTTASAAPAQLSALASGLSPDTTYYYSVTVRNDRNKSATRTGTFRTLASGAVPYGTGHWEGGLLQGYNQGNGQQWGLGVGKSDVEAASWDASGFAASFARGAIASYQTKGSWTNPYDGATYPMDNYNRMWAYGGQMWMEKGRTYYFAANFFISAAITVDGTVAVSETDGGKPSPTVGSVTPTRTGWHEIKVAVASNGNGCGAAGNPWNSGSPFASLKYGTAWNTNGLSSVTSGNAAQWSRLMDEGDRHLLRARGAKPETVFLDGEPAWTASTLAVPVTVDATAGGRTLEVYASRSSDAWYFEDRWEKKVSLGTVAAGASLKTATFTGVDATTNWYVSARLHDSSGYDEWTDAVLFEPNVVGGDAPPAIGGVTAEATGRTAATVEVDLAEVGEGSSSVTIAVYLAAAGGAFGAAPAATATMNAAGSKSLALTGLAAGTDYAVRVVATGSNGLSATDESASFSTPAARPPAGVVAVGTPDYTSNTATVTVSSLGDDASSVSIVLEYATDAGFSDARTLDLGSVSAAGAKSGALSGLAQGTTYYVRAVLTGSPSGATFTTPSVAFRTLEPAEESWFDVKWGSQGWGSGAAWRTSAGETAAGGTWSVPSGDASSRSGSLLALGLPEGGVLRFTASEPTASKATVTVQGTFTPVLAASPPAAPGGTIAGLCFARGGYKGWNGSQWVPLTGATPVAASTAWTATFDWSQAKPRVRFTIGGTVLTASGSEWIPLATSQGYVTGVGYAGGGAVGDFKASYTGGGFVAPILSTVENGGHAPLGFGRDSSNNPTFEITVRNAAKDAWYTVYAADAVDGAYKAVTSVKAAADGLMTLSIPAPSSKPTRFVRIGVSDAQVPENTAL